MDRKSVKLHRETNETNITVELDMSREGTVSPRTSIPFFDHLLMAMAFHGKFCLAVTATGDTEVDPHHLVEDVGLVIGDALGETAASGTIARYGHAVVPMDDSLSTITIDACGRPYIVFDAEFPQARAGGFDVALIREFLTALSTRAKINLHARCDYGLNSHHMAEALFKALGIALKAAFSTSEDSVRSTKGTLR